MEEHDLVSGERIWISLDGRLCAIAQLKESWNVSPQSFFEQMEHLGVRPGILTGDSMFNDSRLKGLKIEKGLSSLEKQSFVEDVVKNDAKVLYVGDGLNDFRAMNASNISIALQHAPDPLLASASAVLASNNLSTVVFSIPYCRRIRRLTKRNEWFFLSSTTLFGFGVMAGWLNPRVAIAVLFGSYLLVWLQSYILGSSILSSVKKRARRRISLKETQSKLAPHRNR